MPHRRTPTSTECIDDHVARIIEQFPPLTEAQRITLARLLRASKTSHRGVEIL